MNIAFESCREIHTAQLRRDTSPIRAERVPLPMLFVVHSASDNSTKIQCEHLHTMDWIAMVSPRIDSQFCIGSCDCMLSSSPSRSSPMTERRASTFVRIAITAFFTHDDWSHVDDSHERASQNTRNNFYSSSVHRRYQPERLRDWFSSVNCYYFQCSPLCTLHNRQNSSPMPSVHLQHDDLDPMHHLNLCLDPCCSFTVRRSRCRSNVVHFATSEVVNQRNQHRDLGVRLEQWANG